jgi:preprotein translocase subunit SecG
MGFIIGLLTLVMVLDCVLLILLVLIQLPKKEAGMGLAFGGAATDALFGAGSGNVLTKITKYAAGIFFVMAIVLSALQSNYYKSNAFLQKLSTPLSAPPGMVPPSAPAASAPPPAQATPPASSSTAPQTPLFSGTNALKSLPAAEDNKLPTPPPAAAPSSNAPAPK